jgi:hypothetical protein
MVKVVVMSGVAWAGSRFKSDAETYPGLGDGRQSLPSVAERGRGWFEVCAAPPEGNRGFFPTRSAGTVLA